MAQLLLEEGSLLDKCLELLLQDSLLQLMIWMLLLVR